MARVNQARQDAEWVLANVLEPTTPLESMALKGAKAALRQLEQLAQYRAKNIDRIRAQNRVYLAKKLGRHLPPASDACMMGRAGDGYGAERAQPREPGAG